MSESKKVALPAYLPRRLQAFRIVQGDTTTYLLRDKLADKTHDLEPWQFFVLEVLPGCETIDKLLSVFEDRFGRQLTEVEVLKFFGIAGRQQAARRGKCGSIRCSSRSPSRATRCEHGLAKPKSFEELAALMAPATTPCRRRALRLRGTSKTEEACPRTRRWPPASTRWRTSTRALPGGPWKLFEIKPLLAALLPLVSPLKWVVYLLPFLGLSALILGHSLRESRLRGPGNAAGGDDAARPCDHQPLGDQHPGGAHAGLHRPGVSRQRRPAEHRPALRLLPALHGADPPHRPAEPARAHLAARRAAADARVPVQRRRARLVQHPRHLPHPVALRPGDRLPLRRQHPARGRQPAGQGQRLSPARGLHERAAPARQGLQGVHGQAARRHGARGGEQRARGLRAGEFPVRLRAGGDHRPDRHQVRRPAADRRGDDHRGARARRLPADADGEALRQDLDGLRALGAVRPLAQARPAGRGRRDQAGRDAAQPDRDLRPHRDRHQPAAAAVPAVSVRGGRQLRHLSERSPGHHLRRLRHRRGGELRRHASR